MENQQLNNDEMEMYLKLHDYRSKIGDCQEITSRFTNGVEYWLVPDSGTFSGESWQPLIKAFELVRKNNAI